MGRMNNFDWEAGHILVYYSEIHCKTHPLTPLKALPRYFA